MAPERIAKGFIEKLENSPLVPTALKPHVKNLKEVATPVAKLVRLFLLLCRMLYQFWANIYAEITSNQVEDYLPVVAGLVMVFYGGSFIYLIAAIEAYRICGWEKTKKCCSELYRNYANVVDSDRADDRKLQEKDEIEGKAREETMSDEEYLNHKLELILRVISPKQAFEALSALLAGFFAIVATLKNGTASSITLGVALGAMFEKSVKFAIQRDVQNLFGEHKAWASPLLTTLCCAVGIIISCILGDTAFVLYSSLKGSDMIVHSCKDLIPRESTKAVDSSADKYCIVSKLVLGIVGFGKQMMWGYGTWFPLNLVISPFLLADWILGVAVVW